MKSTVFFLHAPKQKSQHKIILYANQKPFSQTHLRGEPLLMTSSSSRKANKASLLLLSLEQSALHCAAADRRTGSQGLQ